MILLSTSTTWIGSAPGWLTLVAVAVVGFYFIRGAGGTALSTLEIANRVLEGRVKVLEAQAGVAVVQAKEDARLIAELRTRTDLSIQFQPIVAWTKEHESRDQARFEQTIKVLGEIADRLSPNSGTGMQLPTKEAP